jgi:hypothetical protein
MEADPLTFKQGIAPCLSIILNRQINLNTMFMSRVLFFLKKLKKNPLFRHPPHVLQTSVFTALRWWSKVKTREQDGESNQIKSNIHSRHRQYLKLQHHRWL